MLIKRNFNPIKVVSYVLPELGLSMGLSSLVYYLLREGHLDAGLPFSIAAILGSALAIFIAFRNNSAYARWWEARTLWGTIVNSSRVLGRLVITFTDSHQHQAQYDPARSKAFKHDMVHLAIAWVHALRLQLRKQEDWDSIRTHIPENQWQALLASHHKPNQLHLITGQRLYQAMADGTLAGFDSFQIEGQLLALANAQGGCERIKNTPLLRQYHYFTRLFMMVFIIVLPFCLVNDFAKLSHPWLLIPVATTVAFVFAIIAKVGEVNEDPFENRITDVPLTAICTTIERDLLAMLGDEKLPEAAAPRDGFLF